MNPSLNLSMNLSLISLPMTILGLILAALLIGTGCVLHLVVIPRCKRRMALEQTTDVPMNNSMNHAVPSMGLTNETPRPTPIHMPLPPVGDWLPLPGPNLPLPPRVALKRDEALSFVFGGAR